MKFKNSKYVLNYFNIWYFLLLNLNSEHLLRAYVSKNP